MKFSLGRTVTVSMEGMPAPNPITRIAFACTTHEHNFAYAHADSA